MKLIYLLVIIFIYFNSIFIAWFPNLNILSYWDEGLTIIFIVLCIIKIIYNKGKLKVNDDFKFIAPWIVVVFIGLIGNAVWNYAGASQAIVRDMVGFLKFPICVYAIRFLKIDKKISEEVSNIYVKVIKFILIVMFVCAILSFWVDMGMSQSDELRHGIYSFQFLFNHPNSFGLVIVMILCMLDSYDFKCKNIYIYLSLFLLILTMRTKILAFVAVYVFLKFGRNWAKKYKFFFGIGAFGIILAVTYSKITMVMSWTESGRMRFWTESLNLIIKCFPIGTGFGTFASSVSGKYNSKLYSLLHIKEIYDQFGNPTSVLGDTGYPYYIAQFGLLGVMLLFASIRKLLSIIKIECEGMFSAIYLTIYIMIALIGESTLINAGVELAFTLCLIMYNTKNSKMRLLYREKERREDIL